MDWLVQWKTELDAYVPLAVLSASLLGSLHCVGMCGGIAVSVSMTKRGTLVYSLGRFLGYTTLGLVAGLLGELAFKPLRGFGDIAQQILPWVSLLFLSGMFFFLAVQIWRGQLHVLSNSGAKTLYPTRLLSRFLSKNPQQRSKPLLVGMATAFLPCGWLHGFVLAALATQSAIKGALVLALFWLGTVPALAGFSTMTRKMASPLLKKTPKVAAILFFTAGIATLGARLPVLLHKESPGKRCH